MEQSSKRSQEAKDGASMNDTYLAQNYGVSLQRLNELRMELEQQYKSHGSNNEVSVDRDQERESRGHTASSTVHAEQILCKDCGTALRPSQVPVRSILSQFPT